MTITVKDIFGAKRTTTMFADGAKGYALQEGAFPDYPRLTWSWTRKARNVPGVTTYFVDGEEVSDIATAVQRLNEPPKDKGEAA